MKEKISKKRIILALLPLFIFNGVLVADLVFFKNTAWSQQHSQYEYDKNEKIYNNEKSQTNKENGKELFTYEGKDANCWQMEKEWQVEKCLKEHPYGGEGTLIIGGNLVIDNAQAIYLNGFDSAGFNWIMSTSTEAYGNTMGTRRGGSSDVLYGNNLVANGNINTGVVTFDAAAISIVFNEDNCLMVDDGVFSKLNNLIFIDYKYGNNANVLEILDTGVCGECDGTCSDGKVGKGYRFLSKEGLEVKGVTKVNKQIRVCGEVEDCEEACCREVKYLEDDTWDNFVGSTCMDSACTMLPSDPYGFGPSYCFPQPYPHYARQADPAIADYYSQKTTSNGKTFLYRKGSSRIGASGNSYPSASSANSGNAELGSWVDVKTGKTYILKGNGTIVDANTGEVFSSNGGSGTGWTGNTSGANIDVDVVGALGIDGIVSNAELARWAIETAAWQAVGFIVPTPLSVAITIARTGYFLSTVDYANLAANIRGFFDPDWNTEDVDTSGWTDPDTGARWGYSYDRETGELSYGIVDDNTEDVNLEDVLSEEEMDDANGVDSSDNDSDNDGGNDSASGDGGDHDPGGNGLGE